LSSFGRVPIAKRSPLQSMSQSTHSLTLGLNLFLNGSTFPGGSSFARYAPLPSIVFISSRCKPPKPRYSRNYGFLTRVLNERVRTFALNSRIYSINLLFC
jgi:hypothetical protein